MHWRRFEIVAHQRMGAYRRRDARLDKFPETEVMFDSHMIVLHAFSPFPRYHPGSFRSFATLIKHPKKPFMGRNNKKKPPVADERHLLSLSHPATAELITPIVDTHTHLLSTYQRYKQAYNASSFTDIFDFVKTVYGKKEGLPTKAIVDVWCEAPVVRMWKEIADLAVEESEKWGGVDYYFVMGSSISKPLILLLLKFAQVFTRMSQVHSFSTGNLVYPASRHHADRYSDSIGEEMYALTSPPFLIRIIYQR